MRIVIGTTSGLVAARWVPGERRGQVVATEFKGKPVHALQRSGDRMVASVDGSGLVRSRDGERWEPLTDPVGGTGAIRSLATHAREAGLLLVGAEPAGLFLSSDAGRTWRELVGFAALSDSAGWSSLSKRQPFVGSVALDPVDPNRLYAGVRVGGAYRSDDAGASWLSIRGGLFEDVHRIVVDPIDSTRVFAATGGGLHISGDRGASWARPDGSLGSHNCVAVETMVESGFRQTHLFASTTGTAPAAWASGKSAEAELHLTSDGGRTWGNVDLSSGPKSKAALTALADDPQRAEAGFIGTSAGAVYHGSVTEGEWSKILTGLSSVTGLIVL